MDKCDHFGKHDTAYNISVSIIPSNPINNDKMQIEKESYCGDTYCDERKRIYEKSQEAEVRFHHNAKILCNLWVSIEMYQYFKRDLKDLIYDTLYKNNSDLKNDDNNSTLLTITIINMILQDFGDDFNQRFRNNASFNNRIGKIYMIKRSFLYDRYGILKYKLPFTHKWIDKYVLSILNIPKHLLVTTVEDDYDYYYLSNKYPRYKWKYNYITKETIEYRPGLNQYGEDIKGDGQKDWICNPWVLSRDLIIILIYGFIRILFEQNSTITLSIDIPELCINYCYIHIPACFSWTSGWFINNNKIPIKIDFDTGIVTVRARNADYVKNNSDEFVFGSVSESRHSQSTDSYAAKIDKDNVYEVVQGIWKTVDTNASDDTLINKYTHRLAMKCIENVSNFGIGIKTRWGTLLYRAEAMENKKGIQLYITDQDEDTDLIRSVNLQEIKCGDVLSLKMTHSHQDEYGTINHDVKFYFNGKLFGKYTFTGFNDDPSTYCHPLVIFDTNEHRPNISKFEIISCHLQKLEHNNLDEKILDFKDDLKDDIHKMLDKQFYDEEFKCYDDNNSLHILFSVGNNAYGQGGIGGFAHRYNKMLKLVKPIPNKKGIKKISFKMHWSTNRATYFLTNDDQLYVSGQTNNNDGDLALDGIILEPKKQPFPFKIKDISDGIYTSNKFIRTMNDKIYGNGNNGDNQIGITSISDCVDTFTLINHFSDHKIMINKIESNRDFSVFLGANGNIYYHGTTGLQQFKSTANQYRVTLEVNQVHKIEGIENIVDVCCTENIILILNNKGNVYEWHYEQDVTILFKTEVTNDKGLKIKKMCAGADYCLYLDINGKHVYEDKNKSMAHSRKLSEYSSEPNYFMYGMMKMMQIIKIIKIKAM